MQDEDLRVRQGKNSEILRKLEKVEMNNSDAVPFAKEDEKLRSEAAVVQQHMDTVEGGLGLS